jgi:hypothetical protein
MSIIAQNEAVSCGVHWHFKDPGQTKYGNPNIWYMALFQFRIFDSILQRRGSRTQ